MNLSGLTTSVDLIKILENQSKLFTKGITFIEQGDKEVFLSYNELFQSALKALGYFQTLNISKGNELVLQIEDNKSFLIAFWGCLMGGILPVPLSVGRNADHRQKLFKTWDVLNSPHLISSKSTIDRNFQPQEFQYSNKDTLSNILQRTIYLEDLVLHSKPGIIQTITGDDIAYIQFSSGSTGTPKGVTLTHSNLVANIRAILNGIKSAASGDTFFFMDAADPRYGINRLPPHTSHGGLEPLSNAY